MSTRDQKGEVQNGPKKRRWLKPLLFISLGLNLLFVGLVAGRLWKHGYGGDAAAHNQIVIGAVEKLIKDFPQAKRQRASELLERQRISAGPVRAQISDARKAVRAAALADPYNEDNMSGALRRLREIRSGMHQSLHMTMLELMKDFSLEERQELVKNIRAGFKHRRGHKRRQKDAPGRGAR